MIHPLLSVWFIFLSYYFLARRSPRPILFPYTTLCRPSTTGSTENGNCLTARIVRPPPHGLSRGNRSLSISKTRDKPCGDRQGTSLESGQRCISYGDFCLKKK